MRALYQLSYGPFAGYPSKNDTVRLDAFVHQRLRDDLQDSSSAGDGEYDHDELPPNAEEIHRDDDERRPDADAPEAFEHLVDDAAADTRGLRVSFPALLKEEMTDESEDLVVGEKMRETEGRQGDDDKIEPVEEPEHAHASGIPDEVDAEGKQRNEDDERREVPETAIAFGHRRMVIGLLSRLPGREDSRDIV